MTFHTFSLPACVPRPYSVTNKRGPAAVTVRTWETNGPALPCEPWVTLTTARGPGIRLRPGKITLLPL